MTEAGEVVLDDSDEASVLIPIGLALINSLQYAVTNLVNRYFVKSGTITSR